MKVTATTLPRKSRSATGAPSCEVSAKSGAGPIFGRRSSERRERRACQHGEAEHKCRPPLHAFSSRLSSFRKRQSVPSAMILLRARLDHAHLVQPQRVEAQRVLGVELAPAGVRQLVQRLEREVVALGEPAIDQPLRRAAPARRRRGRRP